jgi:RNA polymerase sigma-70 factor (ECF subfamily)
VDQREVIILRVWGQLTFEEVASIVGVSPNTAASRYRYGLAKLSEIWHGRT